MQINDIIKVPYIDKIVRLTENVSKDADKSKVEELLKGYVITNNVEENITRFFHKVINSAEKGSAFSITGLPGCGKSHFMSVLGLLLSDNKFFNLLNIKNSVLEKSESYFREKKIFVVPLVAEEGGSNISLSDKFFQSAEKISGFPFTDASYYITQFEKAIVSNPIFKAPLNEFIKNDSEGLFSTWAEFRESVKENTLLQKATAFIQAYRKELDLDFFKPDRGRKERLDNLYNWLYKEGYDGVLVLIDELSESLNDRGLNATEDALFLKSFSENAQAEIDGKLIRAWIVGAFLKSVDDFKVPEVIDLMKDRFPHENQLLLTVQDVEDIIDQRLIQKSDTNKVEETRMLLEKKYNAFKDFDSVQYRKIYPLHPHTLNILSKSALFLSRNRSIVDFVITEVKGNIDEGGNVPGIMEEDCTHLVTPDRIWVHFQNRIREISDKRVYFDDIYAYFMGPEGTGNGQLEIIFKDSTEDKKTAIKLIQVMILLKILEVEKNYNVRDLTTMILYPEMKGVFAERKVNDILKDIYDKGRYIDLEPKDDESENIFFINKDISINTKINQATKSKLDTITNDTLRLIATEIIDILNTEPITLSQCKDVYNATIRWENGQRTGLVQCRNLQKSEVKDDLNKALNDLKSSERDFYMFIGTCIDSNKQKEAMQRELNALSSRGVSTLFSWNTSEDEESKELDKRMLKNIIYWIPANDLDTEEGRETLQLMRLYYAHKKLLKEYRENCKLNDTQENKQLLERLEEIADRETEELVEKFKSIYLRGKFYNFEEEIDTKNAAFANESFNKIIQFVADKTLKSAYKDHQFIKPEEDTILTDVTTNKFVKDFVFGNKGKLDIAGGSMDAKILRNTVKKLSDVSFIGDEIKYSLDSKNNKLIKITLEELSINGEVTFKELYSKLRKSSFGPEKNVIEILLALMIRKGYLIPLKSNGEKVSISTIKMPLNSGISKFALGQLVDSKYYEQLMRVSKTLLGRNFEKEDLSKQEEMWEDLIAFKSSSSKDTVELSKYISDFMKSLKIQSNLFSKTFNVLEKIKSIQEFIVEENNSKDGLEYFVESINDYFEKGDNSIENIFRSYSSIKNWMVEGEYQSVPNKIKKVYYEINDEKLYIPSNQDYNFLTNKKEEVLNCLNHGDEFVFGNAAKELIKKYSSFREEYSKQYVFEHSRENSKPEFKGLKTLTLESDYKLLKELSKIDSISIDYDFVNIKHDIETDLGKYCEFSPLSSLNKGGALCTCGFKLGSVINIRGKEYFMKAIKTAIRGYIEELVLDTNKQKVFKRINYYKEISKDLSLVDKVENMYKIPENESKIQNIKDYLMDNLDIIPFIDEALTVNIDFIYRDVNTLIQLFKNKSYSKKDLMDKFRKFIEGNDKIRDEQFVKFMSTDENEK